MSTVSIAPLQVQRTWATLLQSYLLPLLSFTTTDLPTLHEALSLQSSVITHLENSLSDTSTRIMEVVSNCVVPLY